MENMDFQPQKLRKNIYIQIFLYFRSVYNLLIAMKIDKNDVKNYVKYFVNCFVLKNMGVVTSGGKIFFWHSQCEIDKNVNPGKRKFSKKVAGL